MPAPSTGILDDFSGPLSAWTQGVYGDGSGFTTSGGFLQNTAADGVSMAWTTPFVAGDLECYVTLVNGPHNGQEVQLTLSNSISDLQGYMLRVESVAGDYTVRRYSDSFTQTTIRTGTQAMVSGDKIALQRIGDDINLWIDDGSGWVQFDTVADATYTDMEYVAIKDFDGTNIYDDYGGGTPFVDVLVAAGARGGSRVYRR